MKYNYRETIIFFLTLLFFYILFIQKWIMLVSGSGYRTLKIVGECLKKGIGRSGSVIYVSATIQYPMHPIQPFFGTIFLFFNFLPNFTNVKFV